MNSLNKVILLVAAVVSLVMLVGVYLLIVGFGERMMQSAALSQSSTVSRLTFENMYQLMLQGWKRDQVIAFTEKTTKSLAGEPLRIQFYRGEVVDQLYGPVKQNPITPELEKVMRTGKPLEVATPKGGRYIYPLVADKRCMGCHQNAKIGEVMGAITVDTQYDQFIDDSRQLVMIVLLILAPLPFIAAWLVTVYLHNRMHRFVVQIDSALLQSDKDGGKPVDLSNVKPAWSELDEILDCFKRLAARKQ
jgi:hypothetical protein